MPTFRYKRLFDDLSGTIFNPADLRALANSMLKSQAPTEVSRIPAGYTYFGQFVAHDMIYDSKGDRLKMSDRPWKIDDQSREPVGIAIRLDEIENKRNPVLNLETIYGEDGDGKDKLQPNNGALFDFGQTFPETSNKNPNVKKTFFSDLPRDINTAKAKIVDPRNDENLALAQTQVAFMKFHNAIAKKRGDTDSSEGFQKAREIAIRHYQYIILHDLLPKFLQSQDLINEIIADVKAGTNRFYHPTEEDMFIPIEFSVGAYRAMHSMIKDSYNWNSSRLHNDAALFRLMSLTGPGEGLQETKALRSIWLLNWKWFYDIDGSSADNNFNRAEKLNTKMGIQLKSLQPQMATPAANILPMLDLFRGNALNLPTGQQVAGKFQGIVNSALEPAEIESTFGEGLSDRQRDLFKTETPLFYYLLAEAETRTGGASLGEIGSRIIAEVLIKLIHESPFSILKQDLLSDKEYLLYDQEVFESLDAGDTKNFGMPELFKFIAEFDDADFIDPVG